MRPQVGLATLSSVMDLTSPSEVVVTVKPPLSATADSEAAFGSSASQPQSAHVSAAATAKSAGLRIAATAGMKGIGGEQIILKRYEPSRRAKVTSADRQLISRNGSRPSREPICLGLPKRNI
jgi:hypothetical protein